MKKWILLLLLAVIGNLVFSQVVTEYWDLAQTKKKSEQQTKNGMQDGKFVAWFENGDIAREGVFF
jgi:antitoxin component YwqK of YwqJK toxin-antitoxin module